MARIALIKCDQPSRGTEGRTPPLGLMMVAACLREKGNHSIRILDARFHGKSLPKLLKEINPEIVGLSALTIEAHSLHRIADTVKGLFPHATVIAGGPHASFYPEEALSNPNIDIVVRGEGENTIAELVDKDNKNLSGIKGIAFRDDGRVVLTEPRPYIQDLDALPFPAWDLIDLRLYWGHKSMASLGLRKYMALFTSRACPYRCIYCHDVFGKRFRPRSPENVLEEMGLLSSKYGINDFEILDDIFNLDIPRSKKIFSLIHERLPRTKLAFPNGIRGDRMDKEFTELLRRAGTQYISIAVETASPRLQRLIKKNLDLKKTEEAIVRCVKEGIFVNGFFMVGFPTETREEIIETIEFAARSHLHTAMFFIVTPFEGTELMKTYKERIQRFQIEFKDHDFFTGYYNLSEVSDPELFKLQKHAFRRFYLTRWRPVRIVISYPNRKELWRYVITPIKRAFRWKRGH